jgi:putative aminopeptidase FrvX
VADAAVRDRLYETFAKLAALPSPSGAEDAVDAYLLDRLARHGEPRVDAAGNVVLRIAGEDGGAPIALLAHKDEIGTLVKRADERGRLVLSSVGDAHPWIWGEGPVDVLGRRRTVTGILSFGARHVSEESPQRAQLDETPVRWRDVRVETMLTGAELDEAGVAAGTRVVPARSRTAPVRLGADRAYLAAHAIDDKGSVAGMLELAAGLGRPRRTVELVFTAREEIGCHGALWYARRTDAETLVAFEVAPAAEEYDLEVGAEAVLVAADSHGPLHDGLGHELADAAAAAGVPLRRVALARYGSDASAVLGGGAVARTACLAYATANTHGFEIAHLDAIAACVQVLRAWLGAGLR